MPEDWEDIVRISLQHSPDPIDFNYIINGATVLKDDRVVAAGFIKHQLEAVFIPDLTSKKDIVRSVRLLQEAAKQFAATQNVRSLYAYVEDGPYADIIQKKFGYLPTNGKAYYLSVK